jgi:hypothetical protein
MKVIIKINQSTHVELHDVDNYDDAWGLIDEAEQQHGRGIILTNKEFQTIVSQGTIDVPLIFKN